MVWKGEVGREANRPRPRPRFFGYWVFLGHLSLVIGNCPQEFVISTVLCALTTPPVPLVTFLFPPETSTAQACSAGLQSTADFRISSFGFEAFISHSVLGIRHFPRFMGFFDRPPTGDRAKPASPLCFLHNMEPSSHKPRPILKPTVGLTRFSFLRVFSSQTLVSLNVYRRFANTVKTGFF